MKSIYVIIICLIAINPLTAFPQSKSIKVRANHQALCVKDLEASVKFYNEVILLEKMTSPFNNSAIQWLKTGPTTELHLIKGDCAGAKHFSNVHMSFAVSSMADYMKHLDKYNIAYSSLSGEKKPQTRGDGVQQIYFQDPDGYWIEINDAK
ncbi:VOC family protein [Mucilaginibacter hurinus]|uniref:VOC family protein n=1 Tax=Mucilaginibacter hurinus TaxID=2201324 RepID=A0A367GV94_9SPHI|nr:VOC family protein [Mucilaginibacter hurinus]RCH56583.1 VOC family protein [Mucilaginibacter hurinus]